MLYCVYGKNEADASLLKELALDSQASREYKRQRAGTRDLLVKLPDAQVVQTENVVAALLPRMNLVARRRRMPKRMPKPKRGTHLELTDKAAEPLVACARQTRVKKKPTSRCRPTKLPVGPLRGLCRTRLTWLVMFPDALKMPARTVGVSREGFFLQGRPESIRSHSAATVRP